MRSNVSFQSPEQHHHWRSFLISLAALCALGGIVVIAFPELRGLVALGLYCVPTNSVFPLPHEPGVLYFAQQYDAVAIAAVATLASTVMSFADYALVHAAIRHPRLSGVQSTRMFRWAVRWMRRWPFALVFLFSLTPLPITVVRILAPASGYPIRRYLFAQAMGRFPRFFLLAWLGSVIAFPAWLLVAMFALLLGMFWLSSRGGSVAVVGEGDDDEDPELARPT